MSNETRSNSALFKRAEQLKRWEESETNREASVPNSKSRKVQFSAGCVFLAACAAGDKEEVLRLLEKGADIDTANVDGLTALHQVRTDIYSSSVATDVFILFLISYSIALLRSLDGFGSGTDRQSTRWPLVFLQLSS